MKKLILLPLLLAALLAACAKQPQLSEADMAAQSAALQARALLYTEAALSASNAPYRLQTSLRFGTEGDTRRVTGLLWGNNAARLRLDVMAGVGVTAANIVQDGRNFLIFDPRENIGYFYAGPSKPLLQAGVPVPFDLGKLADMLNGHYVTAFGELQEGGEILPKDLARFTLEGKPGGSLDLNTAGLPVFWRESADGGRGWSMEIAYDDGPHPLPRRLSLSHTNGKKAILLVKERESLAKPFTDEQLRLTMPEGAQVLPLDRLKKS